LLTGNGPFSGTALSSPKLSGDQYQIAGSQLTLKANSILNAGTGPSGSLRLELWATSVQYPSDGYSLGHYDFPYTSAYSFNPGASVSNLNQTIKFTAPPDGTYFVTSVLEEYDGTSWPYRDYSSVSAQTKFISGVPVTDTSKTAYSFVDRGGAS